MENLIKKTNFLKASEKDRMNFYEAIEHMSELDENKTRSILNALKDVVSTDEFPNDMGNGTFMVGYALRAALYTIENEEYNGLNREVFDLYIACWQHGPTTGHLSILDDIEDILNIKSVAKAVMNSEQLGILLRALQRSWAPHRCEKNIPNYLSRMDTKLQLLVFEKIIPKKLKLLQSQANEYVRLYAHCQNQAAIHYNDIIRLNSRVIDHLVEKLKDANTRMYMLLGESSGEVVKSHIHMIKTILERGDFPKHGYSETMIENWLRELMIPLKKKPELGRLYYTDLLELREKILPSPKEIIREIGLLLSEKWKTIHASVLEEYQTSLEDDIAMLNTIVNTWGRYPSTIKEVNRRLTHELLTKFTDEADAGKVLDLALLLLKSHQLDYIELILKILQHNKKLINWKEHEERAVQFYKGLHELSQKGVDKEEEMKKWTSVVSELSQKLADLLEKAKLNKQLTPVLFEILLDALEKPRDLVIALATKSLNFIDWKVVKERSSEPMAIVLANLETGKMKGERIDDYEFKSLNASCVRNCLQQISGSKLPNRLKDVMQHIVNTVAEIDFDDESLHTEWAIISCSYVMQNGSEPSCVDKTIPSILKLCKSPIEAQSNYARSVLLNALKPHHRLMKNFADELLELYLQLDLLEPLDCLVDMYPEGSETIHKNLTNILNKEDYISDVRWKFNISTLLLKIISQNPEVIDEDHMQFVRSQIDSTMPSMLPVYLKIAKNRLDLMEKEIDFLLEFGKENSSRFPELRDLLVCLGLSEEPIAEKIILYLVELLPTQSTEDKLASLSIMQGVEAKFGMLLTPHKELLESLQTEPELKLVCTSLLDAIEGRSLAALSTQVTQQQEELDDVKEDVAATGEEVEQLEQRVTAHDEDIDHIKEDVAKAEDRLDAVEETVEETAEKVEELDHKTMSNAPAWSRDVSRLLNPEAAHDWRLLGQRLGYTNDDIRGWATQNDPCMSLLGEWFATHRTSEATHGVLKALEEMNRTDAAQIVQQALDAVDDVVVDEEEMTGPLPPIFLSYEWGRQADVLLLRRHLEMAGFICWMDLGQMGGGDKLYSKIDAGMRASKVLICCVTEKYAKSDNCNREVNLAVTLGKPILPLLMTQVGWPPEGSMGPIFGEYLFIRMFQRPHERTDDNRYWPEPKFQELLMQLRLHIIPDEEIVSGGNPCLMSVFNLKI